MTARTVAEGGAPERCPLPFAQLLLKPTGDVGPCCWLPAAVLGNVATETLDAIWNGPKLRALRNEHLSGVPKTCARLMRHVGCHRRFPQLAEQVQWTERQPQGPKRLDVRLNGRCNLECTMCDVWREPNGLHDEGGFWQWGHHGVFPYLLEIDVLGGEPFIQRDTFRLLDAIAPVNPACTWGFVTNASWRFGEEIRRRLDRIALRYLQVSLDSLDADRYARLRRKGSLARTLETLRALVVYRDARAAAGRPFELRISQCVQRENWDEVPRFLELGKREALTVELQFLTYPRDLSLQALPPETRREILERFDHLAADGFDAVRTLTAPLREALERRHVGRDDARSRPLE